MASEVKLVVQRLEGLNVETGEARSQFGGFIVEFNWGSDYGDDELGLGKKRGSASLRSTSEATLGEDGVILWEEEFKNECRVADLSEEVAAEDLEIEFNVFSSRNMARAKKRLKIGTTSIDLSQWASTEEGKEINLNLPLIHTRSFCGSDRGLLLCISLTFSKMGIQQQSLSTTHKPLVSALSLPQLIASCSNELSESKPVEKKIIVYTRRAKRFCPDKGDNDKKESVKNNCSTLFVRRNQLSNGTRLSNNTAIEASLSELVKGCVPPSAKRKRSKRGSINRRSGPLEVIGIEDSEDDSFQQNIYSDPLQLVRSPSSKEVLEYSKDSYSLPQWEQITVVSRDTLMKLCTQVLFASIDQRSEQAGGSSACSALVVVIADWLHANKGCLPDRRQFDTLIKDGSLEWRELKKNGGLMQEYADAHFDIKTVLHLRPICVDVAKTTIGFFQPEGLPGEVLAFLPGTTSFDDLWKEISEARLEITGNGSFVYIVGWNDHFFLLKVDSEAYYIIDTLGERLFENCDRGYIIKFDKETKIYNNHPQAMEEYNDEDEPEYKTEIIYNGYDCCKHYLQRFLAALPLKEAIENNKKDMLTLERLYGKLQIEFSYTKPAVK